MNATTNSGAVFFLGTRAHYQVLTPPESQNYDLENGNASTETIYQNPSTVTDNMWVNNSPENTGFTYDNNCETVIDIPERREMDYSDGIKRRFLKNRKQEGSTEMILNGNDDIDPTELNDFDNANDKKKVPKRHRMSVAQLLANLARRKRNSEKAKCEPRAEKLYPICTFRDSCRCDDCQGSYFECDESEEEYSISEDSDYPQLYEGFNNQYANGFGDRTTPEVVKDLSPPEETDDFDDDEDDEVFIDSPPVEAKSTEQLLQEEPRVEPQPSTSTVDEDQEEMMLEFAAGAPLFFDHLLNHPITCSIQ